MEQGMFVGLASQKVRKKKSRTDFIAYDYITETPISVEIESSAEVSSHREHVLKNMEPVKWHDELGFKKCHLWSKSLKSKQVYDNASDEQREGVEFFLIE